MTLGSRFAEAEPPRQCVPRQSLGTRAVGAEPGNESMMDLAAEEPDVMALSAVRRATEKGLSTRARRRRKREPVDGRTGGVRVVPTGIVPEISFDPLGPRR